MFLSLDKVSKTLLDKLADLCFSGNDEVLKAAY
jgi:hypothetical protein